MINLGFMKVEIFKSKTEASRKAASDAAVIIRKAIDKEGQAVIVAATGSSQFEVNKFLVAEKGIDWKKVVMFHLDEYIGLKDSHPASFRRYLIDRIITKVPGLKECHLVLGDSLDPIKECQRLNKIISNYVIDVTFAGFGENSRVLKWVFERTDGEGKAVKTPIGYLPTEDAIDCAGLDVSAADMKELLKVNTQEWIGELDGIREHYAKFGSRLPKELSDELSALESRLRSA